MKKLIPFISLVLLMVSCGQSADKTQKVEIADKFTVDVPAVMTKTTGLNEDACLEYQNTLKEYYMIVIDDNIEEFDAVFSGTELSEDYGEGFPGYADFIYDSFVDGLTSYTDSQWKEFKVNNLTV